jgi:hypothetical protein
MIGFGGGYLFFAAVGAYGHGGPSQEKTETRSRRTLTSEKLDSEAGADEQDRAISKKSRRWARFQAYDHKGYSGSCRIRYLPAG